MEFDFLIEFKLRYDELLYIFYVWNIDSVDISLFRD